MSEISADVPVGTQAATQVTKPWWNQCQPSQAASEVQIQVLNPYIQVFNIRIVLDQSSWWQNWA